MPYDNNAISSSNSAIAVGQLVYTSFQEFGFRMLTSPNTPPHIQKSFVDKIVNARWDPHSPPSTDFRAGYVYQISGKEEHTVFGWLYYDGQDDFGRSGVPYFLAYYRPGQPTLEQLRVFLDCLEKGPSQSVSRQIHAQTVLQALVLDSNLNYKPARPGIMIPSDIREKSLEALAKQKQVDWFVTQNAPVPFVDETPMPMEPDLGRRLPMEPVLESRLESQSPSQISSAMEPPQNQGSSELTTASAYPSEKPLQIEAILQEFVHKTMGIQGVALVSEEGHPIVSAIGLDEQTLGLLAGSMLYTTQMAYQELGWSTCELVTMRGPDSYLMLNFFQPGAYLLIQSAKVPMGLLEGVVKRMSNRLKTEIGDVISELIGTEFMGSEQASQSNESLLLEAPSMPDNPKLLNPDLSPHLSRLPQTITPTADQSDQPADQSDRGADIGIQDLDLDTLDFNSQDDINFDIDYDEDLTYRGRPTST